MGALKNTPPRILFLVNVDWFFLSHRLEIARAVRDRGAEVWVGAASTGCEEQMKREGFHFVPIPFTRSGRNLFEEMNTVGSIVRLLKSAKPDLIHNVTIKPVLYGSIAARIVHATATVNAISGMGYLFITPGWIGRVARIPIGLLYRIALGGSRCRVIFQNPDDIEFFVSNGLVDRENVSLIRGSGVDVEKFVPSPERPGIPVVMLASRMLKDKGVGELLEAARHLKEWNVPCRIVLVGDPDPGNPASVSRKELESWQEEGCIEYWGQKEGMERVLPLASVVVLPSYREGIPKVLLEAASVGRPIVATDVPGCREAVREGWNGYLVPPRDPRGLAGAIRVLVENPELRARMGANGREMAKEEFRVEKVVASTITVYESLLCGEFPGFFTSDTA
ncbi:MAG: glycosyltransferase family 1 protein [Syntrophobacterales bacterium]|nr:MAG: glycosyltransferase family 1 protein [Syntrophobacterales bacterium]